jgi:catechol 2,3-dioxygenase
MSMPSIQMADYGLTTTPAPHALALNTWQGIGASPAPEGTAGLRHYTIDVPTAADVDAVAERLHQAEWPFEPIARGIRLHDPSRNELHIVAPSLG